MTAMLLDVPAEAYHADADGPRLSSTIARALVLQTPAHAKQQHPLLADIPWKRESVAMDEGTVLHQMLLGDDRCDILDYDDFRTTAAKEARDAARACGRVPVLRKKWDELVLLGEALKRQVAEFPATPPLFVDGRAEQTIVWDEGGVACRARLDWLRNDLACVDDLKKSRSAQPRAWQRSFWAYGYDMQAAFYLRGVRAAFGKEPLFRWVAIEPDPPYALSVFQLSDAALDAAQVKIDMALEIWSECLRTGVWPSYPRSIQTVELPGWMAVANWDDSSLTEVPF